MNKWIAFILTTVFAVSIAAQSDSTGANGDINVIATIEANREIVTPTKMSELPDVVEGDTTRPDVNYTMVPKNINVDFTPEPIKPAKLKVNEPLDKLYGGYLKAGIGNYFMPLLDFHYGSTRSRSNNWGINLNHLSAGQGPDDVGFSGFSHNAIHGNYKHFLKKHTLRFNANYDRDVAYFYGFDLTDSSFANFKDVKDEIRTTYNLVEFDTELESKYSDSAKVNHQVGVHYYYLDGSFNNRENNFLLDGNVRKYLGAQLVRADFSVDYNNYAFQQFSAIDSNELLSPLKEDGTTGTLNSAIIRVTPSINALKGDFKAKIGASIQVDSRAESFHLFPEFEVKYSLFNNMFIPYVGATGNVDRNSLRTLANDNPFVSSQFELRNTAERFRAFGGIRGSVSSSMSFNVGVSQSRYTDMPMFFNDTLISLQNKFGVVYDNANMFRVGGQLSYRKLEKLKVYLRADYTNYNMDREEYAWHRPSLEVSLGGRYDMADKLIIKTDLFFIGKRFAKSLERVADVEPTYYTEGSEVLEVYYPVELKPIFDANIGVEYRLTEKASAFVNFNNLTTKKYQQWLRYPNQSINIMFGGTIRF